MERTQTGEPPADPAELGVLGDDRDDVTRFANPADVLVNDPHCWSKLHPRTDVGVAVRALSTQPASGHYNTDRSTPNASACATPISLPRRHDSAVTDSGLRMWGVGLAWVA